MPLNFLKFYFLLLVLFPLSTIAHTAIDVSSKNDISILEQSTLYVDTKVLNVREIIKENHLKAYTQAHFNSKDSKKDTVWLGFTLTNNTNTQIEKALVLSSPLIESIELYSEDKLNTPKIKGASHPNAEHSTLSYYYSITLKAYSSKKYYMKVYSHYSPLNFSLHVKDIHSYKKEDHHKQLENTLLIGIVLALILYSFMVYFYARDLSYFLYSIYLCILVYHQVTYLGLTQIYFSYFAAIDIELGILKLGILGLASIAFAISFLNIRKIKKLFTLYKIIISLIIFETLIMSFTHFSNIEIMFFTGVLVITLNLSSGIIAYLHGEEQARLYILGFGIVFLGYSFIILDALGVVPIIKYFPNFIMYATVIEALILLLAFADRYNILQKQKEEADKEREQTIQNEVTLKTAELQAMVETKELLIKEVHHRVKNNLQIILSIIRLEGDTIKERQEKTSFINLENRINAISKTYNMLLVKDNLEEIDMQEYIDSLLVDIQETVHYEDKINIITDIHAKIPLRESVYIGLIINELVTNTYKYAFDNNEGTIIISLHQNTHDYILTIEDDGKGYNSKEKPDTLGLKLIHTLVYHQLGGEMETETNGHTKNIIRFSI